MDWSPIFYVSYVVLWVVVVLQVVLVLALARLVGQLMSRRFPASGARVIDPAPTWARRWRSWEGADLAGDPLSLRFPRQLRSSCSTWRRIARPARLLPSARHFFKEISPPPTRFG